MRARRSFGSARSRPDCREGTLGACRLLRQETRQGKRTGPVPAGKPHAMPDRPSGRFFGRWIHPRDCPGQHEWASGRRKEYLQGCAREEDLGEEEREPASAEISDPPPKGWPGRPRGPTGYDEIGGQAAAGRQPRFLREEQVAEVRELVRGKLREGYAVEAPTPGQWRFPVPDHPGVRLDRTLFRLQAKLEDPLGGMRSSSSTQAPPPPKSRVHPAATAAAGGSIPRYRTGSAIGYRGNRRSSHLAGMAFPLRGGTLDDRRALGKGYFPRSPDVACVRG